MKKRMIFLLLLLSILFSSPSYAEKFREWNVEVELLKNGDGIVKNTWITDEDQGTEKYLPITNLDENRIEDFTVRENGKSFQYEPNWDSDDSREEKAGKYGMLDKRNGVELVFGIGEYGPHHYEFQYTVTNLVKETEDGQTLFWQFINSGLQNPPEKMEILIKGFEPFGKDTVKMWSFGYSGTILLEESGTVAARSGNALTSEDYGTILLQFPEGYFDTKASLSKTQEEIRNEAFKGSDYGAEKESITDYILYIFVGLIAAGIFFIFVGFLRGIFFGIIGLKNSFLSFLNRRKYRQREKDLWGEYYRDLPYVGDLERLIPILEFKKDFKEENIFSVYLLKWIREKAVEFEMIEMQFFVKWEAAGLLFHHEPDFSTHSEEAFYHLLKSASKGSDTLTQTQLGTYLSRNGERYYHLLKDLKNSAKKKAKGEGLLTEETKGFFKKRTLVNLTERGFELFDKNIKFYNFLEDYSLLDERPGYDVHLWEEYMLYAALYGITEKVYKEFTIVEPNFETDSGFTPYFIQQTDFYTHRISDYAKPPSYSSDSSRSSGGGGSSSSGGGGGSSGGGSGGGSR